MDIGNLLTVPKERGDTEVVPCRLAGDGTGPVSLHPV